MASLPVIDIAPYLPPCSLLSARAPASSSSPSSSSSGAHDGSSTAADRAATARAIHLACRDVGFFYLDVSAYLKDDEMREVLELGREFFRRPTEEKEAIGLEKGDGVRGYQKLHQNITQGKADHHEALDLYAPNPYPPRKGANQDCFSNRQDQSTASASTESDDLLHTPFSPAKPLRPLEGPNQWPEHPAAFRPILERWTEKMQTLGLAVMRAMCDGLGMSEEEWEEVRGMVDRSFWVMRVIGYPPLPLGADGISCGEHKDYGCLTFLLADQCPSALQVLPRPPPPSASTSIATPQQVPHNLARPPNADDTRTWLNADPRAGCLVVNIGEMWDRWSGGLYPATLHRVVHRSPTYRVSVPFFFEPNFDARVGVLDAARRRAGEEGRDVHDGSEVVYGDFLLQKVGGNFKY